MTIRIIVIDDHEALRAGIRHLLEPHADMAIVGEASSMRTATDLLALISADVVLLDLKLPDGNGLELLPHLNANCAATRVLVFSATHGREWADHAIKLGCAGFVDKTAATGELAAAIRAVHAGRQVVSVSEGEATPFHGPPLAVPTPPSEHEPLSERESEVLALIARGLTNKEAAKELFLSVKTIETYRARLTRKLGFRGRSELFDYARSAGLMS